MAAPSDKHQKLREENAILKLKVKWILSRQNEVQNLKGQVRHLTGQTDHWRREAEKAKMTSYVVAIVAALAVLFMAIRKLRLTIRKELTVEGEFQDSNGNKQAVNVDVGD